ncbi:TetR/AcrR family transcriptional regulator [Mycobacterium sp. URHD0025]|uniref:TetR/AcrR family transcriptional regulator n=1 Tax=Mycobacterium sp. URHD0025 TaxID=1298864 RepID=UPI00048F6C3E|nr:TetR/AcrR family transcriptional regulator [Mycobacterium sp. URHD0025]
MSESPPPFTRARSDAQRRDRLVHLLATTRDRLTQTPAATLTLGDVAATAGLAKSGILRYVSSREALLLRVMYDEHLAWIDALIQELRATAPATALARTLAARPVLCDLIAASPVLINRLGPQEMPDLMAQAEDARQRLGTALQPTLPLTDEQLGSLTAAIHAFTGTAWAWTRPGPSGHTTMVADFESTVNRLLEIFIAGLLR